jgi:hypothetical protein
VITHEEAVSRRAGRVVRITDGVLAEDARSDDLALTEVSG